MQLESMISLIYLELKITNLGFIMSIIALMIAINLASSLK